MSEGKTTPAQTEVCTKENQQIFSTGKSPSPRSSLIPKLAPRKTREPLTPIQKSARSLDVPNIMVKVKKTKENENAQSGPKSSLTQIQKGSVQKQKSKPGKGSHNKDEKAASSKSKNSGRAEAVTLKSFCDQTVQTENPDVALVTGVEAPPEYYQQLAETRRQALEETITENKELWEENGRLRDKIEKLEQENAVLVELVDADQVEEFAAVTNLECA